MAGRVFKPPMTKWPTRPTTDRAKEALYNILMNRIDFESVTFLDLFGGTGAHSLEFVSRGCREVTYVERFAKCVTWMNKLKDDLSLEDQLTIVQMDVARFLKRSDRSYNIIFADPPYALPWMNELPDLITNNDILKTEGMLIVEHGSDVSFKSHSRCEEERKYGQSSFSFFK